MPPRRAGRTSRAPRAPTPGPRARPPPRARTGAARLEARAGRIPCRSPCQMVRRHRAADEWLRVRSRPDEQTVSSRRAGSSAVTSPITFRFAGPEGALCAPGQLRSHETARMAEWQTRRPQKPLSERACGFKSRSGHSLHLLPQAQVSASDRRDRTRPRVRWVTSWSQLCRPSRRRRPRPTSRRPRTGDRSVLAQAPPSRWAMRSNCSGRQRWPGGHLKTSPASCWTRSHPASAVGRTRSRPTRALAPARWLVSGTTFCLRKSPI